MIGKMLMFTRTSLQCFICDMIDIFCFPDKTIQKIYEKYKIKKCFFYQNLTDTDSTSLFFVFIWNADCVVNEKESRNILFKVKIQSKIIERLDLSDDFWQDFNVQNNQLKKQVGLYKVENIYFTNIITVAVNPKEYFEKYRDKTVKKHKALKRDTPGTNFEAYSQRICSLPEFYQNQKPQKIKQKSFQIIKSNMQMVSVNKTQFACLNDKRFYFNDGIVSLHFGHYLLNKVRKEKYKNEIQYQIHNNNNNKLLKEEATAIRGFERLRTLRSIFAQSLLLYLLDSKFLIRRLSINSTRDYILNSKWQ